MRQSTIGGAAEAGRRIGGRLRQQGTGDIPGVYSSAYGRLSRGASQDINRAGAEIDLAYQEKKTEYDQWREKMDFAKKEYRDQQKYQNLMLWIQGAGALVGMATGIGAPLIAGHYAVKAAEITAKAMR